MAQVNIVSGIYTDTGGDYRVSYPVNYYVIPNENGISKYFLRPAEGIASLGTGLGGDKAAVTWNGVCYRVQGSTLVSVSDSGAVTALGDVAGPGPYTIDYSFDRLIISSADRLYYYSPAIGFVPVTDSDLGTCISVRWFAGYTVSTDGNSVTVSDLGDPTSFNPLRYGSSEADPDKITGLERIRNELYILNRNTIEVQENVGGAGYPFQSIQGAQIMRGNLGPRTYCIFDEKLAFMGGARNEAIGVYIAAPGEAKISSREIDLILSQYSESVLSRCIVEPRIFGDQKLLYIHLPDRSLVYDLSASQKAGEHIWTVLSSGLNGYSAYRGNNFVFCYNKWICGDPNSSAFGYLDSSISTHYGSVVGWEFSTQCLFNQSKGAIIHRLELVGTTGRSALGVNPTVWTSYSFDGRSWSKEIPIKAGKIGETDKRLVWLQQGLMRQTRIQKFRGTSDAHLSFSRLDAELEALNV